MSNFPNWFTGIPENLFKKHLLDLFEYPIKALQIGTYTGDASVWLLENVLKHEHSVLYDVDTWEGSNEAAHHELNWQSVEDVYDSRIKNNPKVIKCKQNSDEFFKANTEVFDFIYIDGDHTSYGVIKDAVNAFDSLATNGILAFDDYLWIGAPEIANRPQLAIDCFLVIYSNKVEVLTKDYQVWIRKTV